MVELRSVKMGLERESRRLMADSPDTSELKWDYECQVCKKLFSIKVPSGPKEERAVKCTACSSGDIIRVNVCKLSETAVGG